MPIIQWNKRKRVLVVTYSFILPLRQYRSSPRVKYLALHIQPSSYDNMRQSPSGSSPGACSGCLRVPAAEGRQGLPRGQGRSSAMQEPPVQSRGNTLSSLVKVLSSSLAVNSTECGWCPHCKLQLQSIGSGKQAQGALFHTWITTAVSSRVALPSTPTKTLHGKNGLNLTIPQIISNAPTSFLHYYFYYQKLSEFRWNHKKVIFVIIAGVCLLPQYVAS